MSWFAAAWAFFVGDGPTVRTNTRPGGQKRVILLEGNIATGKSTLCRALERHRDEGSVSVVMEQVGDAFTRLFYKDPPRYGFAMQLALHGQRMEALREAVSTKQCFPTSRETVVFDRSMLGDWAFALWNRALGNLDDDEWSVYLERAGDTPTAALKRITGTTDVAAVLFLSDDPASCHVRVHRRGGVDADAVELPYLEGLHAAHLLVMASLRHVNITLIELHWAEYASSARTEAIAAALSAGRADTLISLATALDREANMAARAGAAITSIQNMRAREFLVIQANRLGVPVKPAV